MPINKLSSPFYFCEAIEVAVPLGVEARTLEEFRAGLEKLSHASFHYHFIASRLRLHLRTNDFSNWLENSLGLERSGTASQSRGHLHATLSTARGQNLSPWWTRN